MADVHMLAIVLTLLYRALVVLSTGVTCDSTYISADRCFEEYGSQMESQLVRSAVDCTKDCSTVSGCRSVLYDPATKLCRTNSATLTTTVTCSNPIKYYELSKNSCQAPSSMRKLCAASTECTDVTNAECRNGLCKCMEGYGYHDGTKQCLSDCGIHGYGTTYQKVEGAIMMGFFNYDFRPMSADGCKALCINETRFVCRTAEAYVTNSGENGCQLSWETYVTNPEAYYEKPGSNTYNRDCA